MRRDAPCVGHIAPRRDAPAPDDVPAFVVDDIRTDGGTQARAELNAPTVDEYAPRGNAWARWDTPGVGGGFCRIPAPAC